MKRKKPMGHQDPHYFGRGKGHLPGWWTPLLDEMGAWCVNLQKPGCHCSRGCTDGKCPEGQEHTFAVPDRGPGPNAAAAREVMRNVELIRAQISKGER